VLNVAGKSVEVNGDLTHRGRHGEDEARAGGVEGEAVVVGEDLILTGVFRLLPLGNLVVDGRYVED